MRRLLVLLAALGVVAGCSTSIAGTPSPATAPVGATDLSLPPRPRDLKLDGLDPCASLTADQLVKLDLRIFSPSSSAESAGLAGRICTASGFDSRKVSISITFATDRSIQAVIDNPDAAPGDIKASHFAEFPGIITNRPQTNSCVADIDVSPEQFIDIEYRDSTAPPTLSQEQLCQGATTVSEDVLESLLNG